jgi:hypothetical protein
VGVGVREVLMAVDSPSRGRGSFLMTAATRDPGNLESRQTAKTGLGLGKMGWAPVGKRAKVWPAGCVLKRVNLFGERGGGCGEATNPRMAGCCVGY